MTATLRTGIVVEIVLADAYAGPHAGEEHGRLVVNAASVWVCARDGEWHRSAARSASEVTALAPVADSLDELLGAP